jgi:hypothetical protein
MPGVAVQGVPECFQVLVHLLCFSDGLQVRVPCLAVCTSAAYNCLDTCQATPALQVALVEVVSRELLLAYLAFDHDRRVSGNRGGSSTSTGKGSMLLG